MIILSVDYGDKRTGLAVCDKFEMLASPVKVITTDDREKLIDEICEVVSEKAVERIVVGLPKNMDGSEGERAALSRDFAALLERETGLTPVLWDERRSTIEAHAILHAAGKKEKKHRASVDAVAASLLLESYLASING